MTAVESERTGVETATSRPPPDIWKAVAWIGLALVCFTLTAIAGREAGKTVPAINMVFWRNATSLVLLLIGFKIAGIELSSLTSVQPGMQIARALATSPASGAGWRPCC